MASLKEVRSRIVSVTSTQQITKAMKMVAAAKLRRAQDNIIRMRPYAQRLNTILANLTRTADADIVSDYGVTREVRRVLIIAVTSDRGLAGAFNSNVFKGVEEIEHLVSSVKDSLAKYESFVRAHGYYAETRYQVGTDVVEVVTKIARETAADFPNSVFFSGQLLFQDENFFTRLLHNQTSFMVQKRFVFEGLPMIIMPVRVL